MLHPSTWCKHFLCGCAHQTVQASTQEVHRTHLHGGDLGNVDGRAKVQVQQVTQQVTLAGDHVWLVHGGGWTTAHGALACVDTVQEEVEDWLEIAHLKYQ